MKISKRTIILAAVGLVALLAAFASLYFELSEVIKELENIEPEETKKPAMRIKKDLIAEVKTDNQPTDENTIDASKQ
jgi:hypothetical protein